VREEELRDLLAKAGAALKEQHRRSTLTAWSDRELSARLTEHRNRFFRHCLLGEVTEDQIVVQQQALTMPAGTVGQLYGLCTTKVRGTGDISIQGFHPGSKEYRRILREQLKKDDENEPDLLLETELDELSLFLSLYYPGRKFSEQLPEELSKQLPSGCRVDMIHFPGEWHKLSKLYRYLYERITACGECSPAVVDALKMIERRYDDPDFSLREASGWLRVSPSYLSKLVKEHTGLSFVDYLLQYRLDRAADELESSEPDVKVYEIAEHNGFRSHHYFTRQFRRRSGFTPREYRKQYYASS
jgi:two-component system response regulator YesN